jgi:hypothetical protein
LTIELPEPVSREIDDEASSDAIPSADFAALLLCLATAFHDLDKGATPFKQAVKAFSEAHSVEPGRLAALIADLLDYCQVPTGSGKTSAVLEWLDGQTSLNQVQGKKIHYAILSNWRQGAVHGALDLHIHKLISAQEPLSHLLQRPGRVRRHPQAPRKNKVGSGAPHTPWPEGFFERTYGSLKEDPWERQPQGAQGCREFVK